MPEENDEEIEEFDDEHEDDDEGERKPKERKFTQAEVNRLTSREKKEGRRAGRREILEDLGVEDVDELKELLATLKDQAKPPAKKADGSSDEAEAKIKAAEERAKKAEEAAKAAAAQAKLEAAAEVKLIGAGIPADKTARAMKLLDWDDIESRDDLDDAVDNLKEDFPQLFQSDDADGGDEEDKEKPVRNGTPGQRKPKPSNVGRQPSKKSHADAKSAAETRLQQRHGSQISRIKEKNS